jgi:putative flippase GtrA
MIKPPPKARREATRFVKFSVVGTIGAVVDFGTFNLLTGFARVASVPASMLSFTAAITSNFLWNRYWTYPDSRSKPLHRQAMQFMVINVAGLMIRTPIFAALERPLSSFARTVMSTNPERWPLGSTSLLPLSPQVLGSNLALACAVLVVLLWNFALNRLWTYSDVD